MVGGVRRSARYFQSYSTIRCNPMARWTPPSRDMRLTQLRAFGLWVRGEHTLYEIAVAIGIADINPSTAAGRARTRIEQGWQYVRGLPRWDAYNDRSYPYCLRRARLDSHPRKPLTTPPPEPTPFERLLARIEEVEQDARREIGRDGFLQAAEGLRNLRAALIYNDKQAKAAKAAQR